jgi:hypothetical protein
MNVRFQLSLQPVDATHALNLCAGATTYLFNVFLGTIAHSETPVYKFNLSEVSLNI